MAVTVTGSWPGGAGGAPVVTCLQAENSEVLPEGSVAVAVIHSPRATPVGTKLNVPSPLALVVVAVEPSSRVELDRLSLRRERLLDEFVPRPASEPADEQSRGARRASGQ